MGSTTKLAGIERDLKAQYELMMAHLDRASAMQNKADMEWRAGGRVSAKTHSALKRLADEGKRITAEMAALRKRMGAIS